MRMYKAVDRSKVEQVIKVIVSSIELGSSRAQIQIKKGIFTELDEMKARYELLEKEMGEQLLGLSEDIIQLPKFMKKVRMIMIPSVGYFTVVTKQDPLFLEFLNDQLMLFPSLQSCNDQDKILNKILTPHLDKVNWKISFHSETDIYFQNYLTHDLDKNQGDLYSKI